MKKKFVFSIILLMSFLLLLGIYCFDLYVAKQVQIPTLEIPLTETEQLGNFWVTVPAAENRGLSCDVNGVSFEGDKNIYLLLPKDVNQKRLVYYLRDAYDRYATRVVSDFSEDVVIGEKTIKVIQSELPIMYIQTGESGDFAKMVNSTAKEFQCYGDMFLSVSKQDAQKNAWATKFISEENDISRPGTIMLKPRGSSSWGIRQKKSFTLCLEQAEDLLGMGKNKNWNLVSNVADKTLLKSYIFNQLARDMGMAYVPQMRNVELYVNGRYQGVYLLTTKVSVDKKRINLSRGDFLVNWGGTYPEQKIEYQSDTWFADEYYGAPYVDLVYPQNDMNISSKQQFIQKFISSIEDTDSDEYLDYMDLETMVEYYWIQEASMNYDAAFRSTYSYYKKDTQKMYMGPIWDMDMTLGVTRPKRGISFEEPEGWKIRNLSWYVPLFEREEFVEAVQEAYFEGGIRDSLFASLEAFENEKEHMLKDGEMNYQFWRGEEESLIVHYDDTSYEQYTDKTIDFYRRRLEWIDIQMRGR